jgi:hypothetical protein
MFERNLRSFLDNVGVLRPNSPPSGAFAGPSSGSLDSASHNDALSPALSTDDPGMGTSYLSSYGKLDGLSTITVKPMLSPEEENSPHFATPSYLREWFNYVGCISCKDRIPPEFRHDRMYAVFIDLSSLLSVFVPKLDLLRVIASVHNISYLPKTKKKNLVNTMASHCCGFRDCAIYIFKCHGNPRRLS